MTRGEFTKNVIVFWPIEVAVAEFVRIPPSYLATALRNSHEFRYTFCSTSYG